MKKLFILFAILLAFAAQAQQQSASKYIGTPAIPFAAQDLQGARHTLEVLRGKVVVLNLWATFCKPCILEMPALNLLKQDYAGKDLVFLSMTPEDKFTVKRFLKKQAFDFVVLPDNARYMVNFGSTIPQTILIDKAGIVRDVQVGTLPVEIKQNAQGETEYVFQREGIQAKIDALLAE
ncbi:TlpA family protein disulfide reductase [Pontibacter roseus]|uniref:TlpA family protein disulfide reductase n=1 Tax=Pontibacter roseus TaxID=336989 RepID=UPI00036313CE|nr:TlpA disulfide reductase family protein [Pontibacter roseus]